MTLQARLCPFVEVPHLTGSVRDDDAVILETYKLSPRHVSDKRALWEARQGRRSYWWTIWDDDVDLGIKLINQTAAEARIVAMEMERTQRARDVATCLSSISPAGQLWFALDLPKHPRRA